MKNQVNDYIVTSLHSIDERKQPYNYFSTIKALILRLISFHLYENENYKF